MRLTELREAAGMTQTDVARVMDVVPAAVCRWEAGKAMPRADKLPVLADLFGCSIDALFGRGPMLPDDTSLPERGG